MPDEPRKPRNDPRLMAAITEVLASEDFGKHLLYVIEGVLERRALEKRCYPKNHTCPRCFPPHNACRPMVSVMMVPIPFFNPFWWADSCLPRPCRHTMPTCCHHGSHPIPPARHPETTGGTRPEYGPPPK